MFGINCAPELFQKIMERILSGCDGCLNYIDDIIIYGATKEEHQFRLTAVLQRLEEYNVLLNKEKCIYGVQSLQFLGHNLSDKGITPDKEKLNTIRQFRSPETAEEVRSFLGLVNYVGKFLPNLSTITEPLRTLIKKENIFKWSAKEQKAFEEIKMLITSDLCLGYFDINDEIKLIADASPVGLGAVLVQVNNNGPRVISYASKSLSQVEKRYAQTEKEALALVWAVERFHYYLFGRTFDLITDHKPLEVIFGIKSKPCARIERWVLRLQSYKYRVIYKPGKNNIADPLSRLLLLKENKNSFDEDSIYHINWIVATSTPIAIKTSEIIECSKTDDEILAVKEGIYFQNWNGKGLPYRIFETELCFAGNVLLRGNRIVVPEKLRERVIHLAHEGHPGMTIMKRRLRSKVWWPKIDQHAEYAVRSCHGCTLVSAPNPPEPMKRKQLPTAPWEHLAMDYLGPLPSAHNLLVVVDYFSRYFEVEIMKKIDSTETIKRLRVIFARFGLPLSITVDNGKQFTSKEFREFCESNNIKLIYTTPYWPQQNGEVERQNRSILKRLTISQNTGRNWIDDLQDYLMMYRTTQHSTTFKTPSEMMFGRNNRDKLPCITNPVEIDEEMADRDKVEKEKEKVYVDARRNARQSDINIGDSVLIKRFCKLNKLSPTFDPNVCKVISISGAEAVVESEETHKIYRRNLSHLKKLVSDPMDLNNTIKEQNHMPINNKKQISPPGSPFKGFN